MRRSAPPLPRGLLRLAAAAGAGALLGLALRRRRGVAREGGSAEERLRESESRFHTLANSIPQLAWMADERGHIFWYNQRWYDYTGTTLQEMEGWGWRKVHHPDHVERVVANISHSWRTGEPWEDVFPLRGRDGTYRWFLSRALPTRDEGGRVIRWFGTNTDITESRQVELDLQRARDEAEAANRTKSLFLANMSHELRTPLNAILGYSELLKEIAEERDLQEMVQDLRKINAAGKHLLSLINDVLDLSKIEAGKMDIHRGRFAPGPLIEEVAATLQPLVEAKGNRLAVECTGDLGVMSSDETKVRQCLLNLLSNAAKFTEGGLITVRAVREAGGGPERLILSVCDTGVGMSDEQLAQLFRPFTQADVSTSRRFGGTGLGLALTRSFCELLGGDITVESRLGEGSRFTLRLPVDLAP